MKVTTSDWPTSVSRRRSHRRNHPLHGKIDFQRIRVITIQIVDAGHAELIAAFLSLTNTEQIE